MADLNISQFLAMRLRNAADALHSACDRMSDDQLQWKPTLEGHAGRSALEQVCECAYLNQWATAIFRSHAVAPFDNADYEKQTQARYNREALFWLLETTNALAQAVAGFPAGQWGAVLTHPFTRQPVSWAEFADFFYWNTAYHEGQVNYIQTLYGDKS
jgi:hypothetical protein